MNKKITVILALALVFILAHLSLWGELKQVNTGVLIFRGSLQSVNF